jgi:hypothetical protein
MAGKCFQKKLNQTTPFFENFAQVKESELSERLKDGWQIVKELSNGEVIVKRIR